MNLPPIPRESADWRNLKLWLSIEIRKAQRQLEAWPETPQQYDILRGRIDAYRALIAAVEPEKVVADDKIDRSGRDYLGAGESLEYPI